MQKIMVCLKRVIDYNVRVRVSSDGSGVVTDGVKMSINPFDEIALEEALRIRERGEAGEILAVSLGSPDCRQQLRTALAMGADRALLIETRDTLEPLALARALHAVVERERPDLVLMGKQAIDSDNNQTGQMLAALWQRPQATFASAIVIGERHATVTREVDAGLEVLEVDLPAVITTDLRLNEPRYVKLPDIMKAKRKPLDTWPLCDLGIDASPQFHVLRVDPPPPRGKGTRVESVGALLDELERRGVL